MKHSCAGWNTFSEEPVSTKLMSSCRPRSLMSLHTTTALPRFSWSCLTPLCLSSKERWCPAPAFVLLLPSSLWLGRCPRGSSPAFGTLSSRRASIGCFQGPSPRRKTARLLLQQWQLRPTRREKETPPSAQHWLLPVRRGQSYGGPGDRELSSSPRTRRERSTHPQPRRKSQGMGNHLCQG